MNRDSSARLTISSPLEAHKSHTLAFDIVGVDVGFENPMFACLEIDYEVCFTIINIYRTREILRGKRLPKRKHLCRKQDKCIILQNLLSETI